MSGQAPSRPFRPCDAIRYGGEPWKQQSIVKVHPRLRSVVTVSFSDLALSYHRDIVLTRGLAIFIREMDMSV